MDQLIFQKLDSLIISLNDNDAIGIDDDNFVDAYTVLNESLESIGNLIYLKRKLKVIWTADSEKAVYFLLNAISNHFMFAFCNPHLNLLIEKALIKAQKMLAEAEKPRDAAIAPLLRDLCKFACDNFNCLVRDMYGTHPLRSVLYVSSGVKVPANVGGVVRKHDIFLCFPVMNKFHRRLCAWSEEYMVKMPKSDLKAFLEDNKGSSVLQALLICSYKSMETNAFQEHCQKLLKRLHHLSKRSLKANGTKGGISPLLSHPSTSYFMQQLVALLSDVNFQYFYSKFIQTNVIPLLEDEATSFIIQECILSIHEPGLFTGLLRQLQQELQERLFTERHGILRAFVHTCLTNHLLQQRMLKTLLRVFRCNEDRDLFFYALLHLSPKEVAVDEANNTNNNNNTNDDDKECVRHYCKVSLTGSLIVQDLLHYNNTNVIVESILNTSDNQILIFIRHPIACYAVEAFISSDAVKAKSKVNLFKRLKFHLCSIVCDKYGSRIMDAFWLQNNAELKEEIVKAMVPIMEKFRFHKYGRYCFHKYSPLIYQSDPERWKRLYVEPEAPVTPAVVVVVDPRTNQKARKRKHSKISEPFGFDSGGGGDDGKKVK